MKHFSLCIFFTFTVVNLCAQHEPEQNLVSKLPLTLQEVWNKADVSSKDIQMKKLLVDRTLEDVKDALMERLPELSIGGNIEKATNIPVYENGLFNKPTQHEVIHTLYKIGADSYLNLYNGNKTNLKISEEKTHHKIAIEQKNLTVSETRLLAAAYYLDLQKSIIFKNLMIKDIENQEKQLAEIKALMDNGVVLRSDVLRVELKLSHQKMTLVKIENDILLANQKLNIIIGEPDERPVEPVEHINPDSLLLKTYEEYLDGALEKSYQYRISEQETELKKIQLKYIKANVAPKIGLTGDFYFANPQIFLYPYNPSLYSLGIGAIRASFPVSSFYHNRHKEKAAMIKLLRQEVEHADTQDNVRKQVKSAFLRFKEGVIRIGVARVNVEQAKENYRIIRNTYFKQTSLITDLLDADVQLLQTQFELTASKIAAEIQYFELLNVIGEL